MHFDKEWTEVLEPEGLKYFHMTDFAQSTGQFASGWKYDEGRRRKLIQELTRVICGYVQWFVSSYVLQKDYDAANYVYMLHEYAQPYPLCGLKCIEKAHEWRIAQRLDYLPMEYVFEEGDQHCGQLWQRAKERYGKYPLFRPKIPGKAKLPPEVSDPVVPLTPLQVSDFVAYESGKISGILTNESTKLFQRFRASFGLIGKIPHIWAGLSEADIRAELNLRGIQRRQRGK